METENPFSSKAVRRSWIRKELNKNKDSFCDKTTLKIHCTTFNVNDRLPPPSDNDTDNSHQFESILGSHSDSDLFVFGFQELDLSTLSLVSPTSDTRCDAWKKCLLSLLGEEEYEPLTSIQFVGVLLIIITKKSLLKDRSIDRETSIQTHGIPIGMFGITGNKAGVAVRLKIRDSVFVFVTSHLAAFTNMKE